MKFLSDLISEMIFLMVVYMRGSRFFLGRRRKIMFASGDREGGGEPLFPIIWFTM